MGGAHKKKLENPKDAHRDFYICLSSGSFLACPDSWEKMKTAGSIIAVGLEKETLFPCTKADGFQRGQIEDVQEKSA